MSTAETKDGNSESEARKEPSLLGENLFRISRGLPRRELNLMITEADDCEALLLKDIQILEEALAKAEKQQDDAKEEAELPDDAQAILNSVLTPMDRYWTLSSLLGRLRDDWMLPSIHQATDEADVKAQKQLKDNSYLPPISAQTETLLKMSKQDAGVLFDHYTRKHESRDTLLAVWKKIFTHRSSTVFKKPVKPEEAPGYAERIVFPMDLSMIRKLIVAKNVKSFAELHDYVGLISHNCVKYNGRETDWGNVAREFEAAADELIIQAVEQSIQRERASSTKLLESTQSTADPIPDETNGKKADAMDVSEE